MVLRILLIEDDASTAILLTMTLEQLGYEICGTEGTADGAVRAAVACRPDLIIADVNLDGRSGIEAMDEICLKEFVPHIFASGDIGLVKKLKPDAIILEKPFRYGQLVAAIDLALKVVS